jgi:membrane protein implicated in regulation of membrane protease activity
VIAGYIPAPPQDWTPAQITAKFTEHNTAVKVGMVGTLFFAPCYFVWTTLVSRLIRRMEGPNGLLSQIELLGGALTVVVTQLFSACWLAGAFHIGDRRSQDVLLMHDLGWMFFNMTFVVTFVQMLGFGSAILTDPRRHSLFPRWLAWVSYGCAATFLVVVLMPFVKNGPFAWNGLLTYWVALIGYWSWAVLAMYFVFPAIRRVEEEDSDAATPDEEADAQNGNAAQAGANGPRRAHSRAR